MSAWLAAVDPRQARDDARSILAGNRYHPRDVPRPLQAVIDWIGERLAPVGRFVSRTWDDVPSALRPVVATAAILALIAAIVYAARRVRRSRRPEARATTPVERRELDARALEARADAAERDGDHALAVRLRFQAGLVRLDHDAHAIEFTPALVNTAVRATLHDDGFDSLATTFEEITYGERAADATQSSTARTQWPTVVRSARR